MEKEISRATLKRLPTYLSYLKGLPENSGANISATATYLRANICRHLNMNTTVRLHFLRRLRMGT